MILATPENSHSYMVYASNTETHQQSKLQSESCRIASYGTQNGLVKCSLAVTEIPTQSIVRQLPILLYFNDKGCYSSVWLRFKLISGPCL